MTLPVHVLRTSTSYTELIGVPTSPSGLPSAPQNLQATAGNTWIQTSCDPPASLNGSPIAYYLWTATDPNNNVVTLRSDAADLGVQFTGLTTATTYTIAVVAVNSKGESPAATTTAATSGATAAWDPRTYDWDANVGTTSTPTTVIATAKAGGTMAYKPTIGPGCDIDTDLSDSIFDESLGYLLPQGGPAGLSGNASTISQHLVTFTNCLLNTMVFSGGGILALVNCDVFPSVASQHAAGVEGGATEGPTTLSHCDVGAIIDASDPGTDWFAQYCRFGNAKPTPIIGKEWGGGMPGTSNAVQSQWMPEADLKKIEQYTPGEAITADEVSAGCFRVIYPSNENNHFCYQIIAPGTIDDPGSTVNHPNVPWASYMDLKASDTTQPFIITGGASGAQTTQQVNPTTYSGPYAILICVGGVPHADGLQSVNASRQRARRCYIVNPANSAFFMQSAGNYGSPITRASLEESWVFGGYSNKWAVVESLATWFDPNSGGVPSGYYRDSTDNMKWTPYTQGQVITLQTALTQAITAGDTVTKLYVGGFPVPIQVGQSVTVSDGTNSQTFKRPATGSNTTKGQTGISVNATIAQFSFPVGATVTHTMKVVLSRTRPRGVKFVGNVFGTLRDGVTYPNSLGAACIDGGPTPLYFDSEQAWLNAVAAQYQLASGQGDPFVDTVVGTTAAAISNNDTLTSLPLNSALTEALPANALVSVSDGTYIDTFVVSTGAAVGDTAIPLTSVPINAPLHNFAAGAQVSFGDLTNIMGGAYDWGALDASIAAGKSNVVLNQTTLNNRLAAGLSDPLCDMRCGVMAWDNIRGDNNAVLLPNGGYYTGG